MVACSNSNNTGKVQDVGTFSWANVEKAYLSGESGGRSDGFKNTTVKPITTEDEAINLAKNEVAFDSDYETVNADYDKDAKMWRVVFCMKPPTAPNTYGLDGGTNIYIDSNGITKLIVTAG